jgi:cell division protein FtsX
MKDKALTEATWKPYSPAAHGRLSTAEKNSLPATAFAFPHKRKEPMTDAAHVRDAIARFNQVGEVTDSERDLAFANLQKAANHFDIQMKETNWRQFGSQRGRQE